MISSAVQAQQAIKGRVIDEQTDEPMPFVSVFINTTTIGTSTDENGAFSLKIAPGSYEIIVSYIGYEPIIFTIGIPDLSKTFLF